MGRYKEAPWNFRCPYEHNCPHLGGVSTTWARHLLRTESEDRREYYRVVEDLSQDNKAMRAENDRLTKELAAMTAQRDALHRRQFKANRVPKGTAAAPTRRKKKRGPPFGHPPWTRPAPDHIDETREVPPPIVCPHCGDTHLTPITELHDHLQEDIIVKPRTHVTQFRHQQAVCSGCHRTVMATAEGELLTCAIGPTARSVAVYLRYGLHIPYRGVQKIFADLFGLRFVPATAVNFDRQAARKGQPLYDDLKSKLQATLVAHGDETRWPQDGKNVSLWFGGNPDVAIYRIAPSRGGAEAVELFGEHYPGVLNTDDYAGYNAVKPKYRQTCWAHLSRTGKEIGQMLALPDAIPAPRSIVFCKRLIVFAKLMCRLGQQLKAGTLSRKKARGMIPRLDKQLMAFASTPLDNPKAENLRLRITVADRKCLFVFLDVHGVEPTNNHAEQSLRGMVIMRKISFGTRSDDGSVAHSILPSLLITAERQGRSPLEFFQALFTTDTATAHDALYRRPLPNTS